MRNCRKTWLSDPGPLGLALRCHRKAGLFREVFSLLTAQIRDHVWEGVYFSSYLRIGNNAGTPKSLLSPGAGNQDPATKSFNASTPTSVKRSPLPSFVFVCHPSALLFVSEIWSYYGSDRTQSWAKNLDPVFQLLGCICPFHASI